MKTALTAAFIALAAPVAACDFTPDRASVLLGSHHINSTGDYNEQNPGLFLTWECGAWNATAGAYVNSFSDTSYAVLAGYDLLTGDNWAVTALGGAAYYPSLGYDDGEHLGAGTVPVAALQARYANTFIQYLPAKGEYTDGLLAAGLTFDF